MQRQDLNSLGANTRTNDPNDDDVFSHNPVIGPAEMDIYEMRFCVFRLVLMGDGMEEMGAAKTASAAGGEEENWANDGLEWEEEMRLFVVCFRRPDFRELLSRFNCSFMGGRKKRKRSAAFPHKYSLFPAFFAL